MELRLALRLGFLLGCIGVVGGTVPPPKAKSDSLPVREHRASEVVRALEDLEDAKRLFFAMRYREAAEMYRWGLETSRRLKDEPLALHFLNGLGNCHLAVQEYRSALRCYLDASKKAEQIGDAELAAGIASNICSLYLQLGDVNSSLEAAERGLRLLPRKVASRAAPPLLIQSATLQARSNNMSAALRLFGEAIEMADRLGDSARTAFAWDQLGYEYLQRGQLDAAEEALLEAFRLRKMFRLPDLQYSYYTLGMLRMAQGDLNSASRLLDEAVRLATATPGALPLWRVYHQRGRLRFLQGELASSLLDLQVFLDLARRVWLEFLTADSARTTMEGELHQACSTYISAAAGLYFRTGRQSLARRAFEAAEANRAVSLMAWMSTPAGWRERLPAGYWETLAQVQSAQTEVVRQDSPVARSRLGGLLSRLTEMEAVAGLEIPGVPAPASASSRPDLFSRTKKVLRPEEAFFSFHLGETESYRWVLTNEGLQLRRLPPKARIRNLVRQFRGELEKSAPEAGWLGGELHSLLFGGLPAQARRKRNWLLAADDALFDLPFAALVVRQAGGEPRFLIESHALRMVPSASMLASRKPETHDGPFVGLADAVYNQADPRWVSSSKKRAEAGTGSLLAGSRDRHSFQLARLAGSNREVERCARTWRRDPGGVLILKGPAASKRGLIGAMQAGPSVLHVAAHFRRASLPSEQALIALSLDAEGEPELLGPTEISRWRFPMRLVVLSGCASGQAAALPGTGLMGLTRAWLAAGASAVAASLWPTADDTGELFAAFYGHLRSLKAGRRPGAEAEALRLAQLDMLRSRSWRADPRYWAAFFIVGKE